MNVSDTYTRFGGVTFEREDMPTLRALARGTTFKITSASLFSFKFVSREVSTLRRLYHSRFAEFDGSPDQTSLVLRASPGLLELQEKVDSEVVSFDLFAEARGIDISRSACKKYLRKGFGRLARESLSRKFPTKREVDVKAFQEAELGTLVENTPVFDGDRFEYSSRELTDWYVKEFLSRNNFYRSSTT